MKVRKFHVTMDWTIVYSIINSNKVDSSKTIKEKLLTNGDPTIKWCTALQAIFGKHSNNFDGYIQKVEVNDKTIDILCYIIENDIMNLFKIKYPESWENEETKLIEASLRKYGEEYFSHWENDKKLAWLSFTHTCVKHI